VRPTSELAETCAEQYFSLPSENSIKMLAIVEGGAFLETETMKTTRAAPLTESEIEAVLTVSGDANSWETALSVSSDEEEAVWLHDAYERGIAKLAGMLSRRRAGRK
jgi:hypothetical protein